MVIEVDKLMIHATIAALRAGRGQGVNDMGLLEDWEEKLKDAKTHEGVTND